VKLVARFGGPNNHLNRTGKYLTENLDSSSRFRFTRDQAFDKTSRSQRDLWK